MAVTGVGGVWGDPWRRALRAGWQIAARGPGLDIPMVPADDFEGLGAVEHLLAPRAWLLALAVWRAAQVAGCHPDEVEVAEVLRPPA